MRKPLSVSCSLLLFCLFLMFSGCTKEEIIPQATNPDPAIQGQMATSGRATAQSCCTVGTGVKQWCSWQPSIQSVLTCCHVEPVNPPCYFTNVFPPETYTFYMGEQITLLATGAHVDDQILQMVDTADEHRPGFNYVITDWEVTYYGTYNSICTLQITVTYRRRFCSFY